MKKKLYAFCITLAVSLLSSCAPQFVFIAPQDCAEATALKNICSNLQNDTQERMVADSIYNQGAALIRTGKNEKAHVLLNRAIVRYRLVLVRNTIAGKEREIALQKRGLSEDLDELSACRRILDGLTPVEKP